MDGALVVKLLFALVGLLVLGVRDHKRGSVPAWWLWLFWLLALAFLPAGFVLFGLVGFFFWSILGDCLEKAGVVGAADVSVAGALGFFFWPELLLWSMVMLAWVVGVYVMKLKRGLPYLAFVYCVLVTAAFFFG